MKLQKRHIVLCALILALAAAVFINWQYNPESSDLISSVSKELGAATYVNADSASNDEVVGVSKQTTKADEFFAKAEVERQQTYDDAVDLAQQTLKLSDASDEAKAVAVEQLNKLEDNMITQINIEGILKGKGFSKCLCYISDSNCTVTVLKKDMKENSPLIIKDAVLSQLDIDFNSITIVET